MTGSIFQTYLMFRSEYLRGIVPYDEKAFWKYRAQEFGSSGLSVLTTDQMGASTYLQNKCSMALDSLALTKLSATHLFHPQKLSSMLAIQEFSLLAKLSQTLMNFYIPMSLLMPCHLFDVLSFCYLPVKSLGTLQCSFSIVPPSYVIVFHVCFSLRQ